MVFRSEKPGVFLAGADIQKIAGIRNREECDQLVELGQELFSKLSNSPVRTLAVIDGACVGGGLEFVMACDFRIAVNHAATKLGLPEVKLGLIPAWGGTQRLPKLVGLTAALPLLLEGRLISPEEAYRIKLVDEIIDSADDEAGLKKFIQSAINGEISHYTGMGWKRLLLDSNGLGRKATAFTAQTIFEKQAIHYPALQEILQAAEIGASSSRVTEEGLRFERNAFWKLLSGEIAPELIKLYLNQEQAKRSKTWVQCSEDDDTPPRRIKKVAVIGAGTMGAGIAQLLASRGFKVVLQDISDKALESGEARIQKLFDQAVQKNVLTTEHAEEAKARIQFRQAWEHDDDIDLMIDAVLERLEIKQDLFQTAALNLPEDCLLVSNTSALPIDQFLRDHHRNDQVAGLHFFNPVHKMMLVEVIRTPLTSDQTVRSLVELVKALGKVPVVVKQSPGFLVNRILFPYLDEAIRLHVEGYPRHLIENAAIHFGMPMGPLELLDVVGLDVAYEVSRTCNVRVADPSPTPAYLQRMIEKGSLGKKSGKGFYEWKQGRKSTSLSSQKVISISDHAQVDHWTIAGDMLDVLQQRLVLAMVNESQKCLNEQIVEEPWMVDLAMVLGTGFPPYRGGPMACVDKWSAAEVVTRLERLSVRFGDRFSPADFSLKFSESEG